MPGDYIKCPRCELNYIKKGEEYCDVCKAELNKGSKLLFVDNFDEENDLEDIDLCPRCHQNYVKNGEEYCESCLKEIEREEADIDPENDDSWKEYLDDDTDFDEEEDEELRSLDKLAEEEGDELFDDEEEEYTIVGSKEVDPFAGKISNESPIAQAILNHKVNDIVDVVSPAGSYPVKILEIC